MAREIPIGTEVKFRISPTHTLKGCRIDRYGSSRLLINHPYNDYIRLEIKAMKGSKYHGYDEPNPLKAWSVEDCERNRFQLQYLMDMNPYAPYDAPLIKFEARRRKPDGSPMLYNHQIEIASHILTRRQCIVAGEMGVGKTLSAIEAMEASGIKSWLWVGPLSALDSVKYDFWKWAYCIDCGKYGFQHKGAGHMLNDPHMVLPKFMTYESLRKLVETWPKGTKAPQAIVFDECSRIKTPTAQRTQAAQHLTDSMRDDWGRDAYIVLMSGSPAPKDPSDWWSLAEIARPGFVREGEHRKFKERLCLIKMYDGLGGGRYPKLITWFDDAKKCKVCGKFKDDPDHEIINHLEPWYHEFKPSKNEVLNLYNRLKGLTIVKLKSECLDLPEKVYRKIICKATPSVLRAADLLSKTSRSTIQALTLLRELSDGFQYKQVEKGTQTCPTCEGRLKIKMPVDLDDPDNPLDEASLAHGKRAIFDPETDNVVGFKDQLLRIGEREIDCTQCGGDGAVPRYEREAVRVDCPKDTELLNLLDLYEDEGRVVIWAGFTESVDRCVQTCIKADWAVIRLDGRGWWSNSLTCSTGVDYLKAFDDKARYPKIAFVGQPGAGGMGLNLTASSMEAYYSNTFKGEDRSQSEDRIHRPGADHNRGVTIYDLIHLPQDLIVVENLKRKKDLQFMSMGQLSEAASKYDELLERTI